ncbi:unnamed protein product [Cylicocyclus nassatus]|uniref:Uncharacterized protein n=1 Tax=Cylicocyclus nassatus TaxID=53992 RepID=A0AA36GZR6_CYLNA|nr:unnamed protein product [Cylicocyclus nassatus]
MLMLPSPVLTLYFLQIIFLCDAAFTRHRRPFLGSRGRLLGGSHSRVFNGHRGNFGRSVNGGISRGTQPLHGGPQKIPPRGEMGRRFHPRYQEAMKSHGYDLGRYRGGSSREWSQHRQELDYRETSHNPSYRGGLDHKWDRGNGRNYDPRYRQSQTRNGGQIESRSTARGFSRGSVGVGYRGNLYNNFFANPLRNGYWSRYGRYYRPGFFGSRYRTGYGGFYHPGLGLNPEIDENRSSSEINTGRDPSARNTGRNLEQSSLQGSDRFFSGNAGERGNIWGRDRSRNFSRGGGAGNMAERSRFGNLPSRGRGFIIGGRNMNTLEEIRIGGRGGTSIIERGRNEDLPAKAEEVPEGDSGNIIVEEREESGERGTTRGLVDRGIIEKSSDRAGKSSAERGRSSNLPERAEGAADGKELLRNPTELERVGAKRGGAENLLGRERSGFPVRSEESLAGTDRSGSSAKEGMEMKKNGAGSIIERGHFENFPGGTGSVKERDRSGNLVKEERNERNRFGSFERRAGGGSAVEKVRSETVGERRAGMERSRSENILGREANVAETHRTENFADVGRSEESAAERVHFGNSAGEGRLGKTGERGTSENVAEGREGKAVSEGSFNFNRRDFYDGFYDDFMRYSLIGGTLSGVSGITMAASTLGAGAIQSQIMQNSRREQLTQDIQAQQNTTRKSESCVATFAYMAMNGSPVYKCECSGGISYQYNRCVAPGG